MKSFKEFLAEENKKYQDAEKALEDASYSPTFEDYSDRSRLNVMGFETARDEESKRLAKETFTNKPEGKPLGQIPLPTKVTQDEVYKERAKALIPYYGKLPPIKVALVNGEYVVVDGHHRLAAAKALGKTTISANQIN